jgi:hypothetical protein
MKEIKEDTYTMESALTLPGDSLLIPNLATQFCRTAEVGFKPFSYPTAPLARQGLFEPKVNPCVL